MNQIIIYKHDNGGIAIIFPSEESIQLYGIDMIAQKDVPEGKKYLIADKDFLPLDIEFRNAWTIDDLLLTSGVGHKFSSFEEIQNDNG